MLGVVGLGGGGRGRYGLVVGVEKGSSGKR